jgi:hypothetical protein
MMITREGDIYDPFALEGIGVAPFWGVWGITGVKEDQVVGPFATIDEAFTAAEEALLSAPVPPEICGVEAWAFVRDAKDQEVGPII